jgi:chromate reductase
LYNQDYDDGGGPPREWQDFRREIKALDGASRPFGQNAWDGKPGAVVSVTPGRLGAFGANHQLRRPMVFLNIPPAPAAGSLP